MNISRFFGATNREALRQVRLALGPDALIISNRRVNGGVEILATDQTALPDNVVQQIAAQEAEAAAKQAPVTMRTAFRRPDQASGPVSYPGMPGTPPTSASGSDPRRAGALSGHMSSAEGGSRPTGAMPSAGGLPPSGLRQPPATGLRPAPAALAAAMGGPTESSGDVLGAIGALQGVLESRIDELLWGSQLRRAPQAISLFQTLLGFGFSTALLRAMLKRLPENMGAKAAFQWARNELVRHLPVLETEDELWQPGAVVALVGPTGVGKTTTVAKLAARCVKRLGAENVVLLTTDTYRIGAHEQLRIYGQMMRVPVHVVQDAAELRRILGGVSAHQTVLIDNVGISQRDRHVAEQATMLGQAGRDIQRLLVLNASSHGDTLDEVARSYTNDGGSRLRGCIITKVDEATRLGAALDTAIRYQLPVCYISDGQKVPQNLSYLSASDLVDRAMVKPQSQALYAPSEADFAALMSMAKPAEETPQNIEKKRRQLLPNLLTVAGSAGSGVELADIEGACAQIDDDLLTSETYELWRRYFKGDITDGIQALGLHLLRAAQNEFVGQQGQYMLALHDQIALRESDNRSAGRLRATVLCSQSGTPWASPYQQLTLADGWRASDGSSALQAPGNIEALLDQISWVAQSLAEVPVLHVFDQSTQALWHAVSASGAAWLSPCPATTKVYEQGCATTVGALSKAVDYHPVGALNELLDLAEIQSIDRGRLVVWAGVQAVELVSRQAGHLPVLLVAARVVDRDSGTVLRTVHGLAHATTINASPERLAMALLVATEQKAAFRLAARWWPMLAPRQWADASQKRALTAIQVGLATWHALAGVETVGLRKALLGLAGNPRPTQVAAVSAMMKLFTLKEMTV
ncbi:flagellar biosynthesis protein FlhF [Pusillimonas sp. T2]|uniref:flagellar biosynthesis protein FlhF n=1 Tax=Pusillimonas sp. T2 TaxID=1548123 RepID=UPI000B9CDC68|nr:flagellar biosynthesis protein FlhF [Pusillimonas sp. T2]OXR49707.1 flagellar biosynthesis protein FlhF [Pusillimonas sp. T2]